MRSLKELQPVLAAIYYINRTNGNDDEDIRHLVDYAFQRILNNTTNLLLVACIGKAKKDVMPKLIHILSEDTNYIQYLEEKKK